MSSHSASCFFAPQGEDVGDPVSVPLLCDQVHLCPPALCQTCAGHGGTESSLAQMTEVGYSNPGRHGQSLWEMTLGAIYTRRPGTQCSQDAAFDRRAEVNRDPRVAWPAAVEGAGRSLQEMVVQAHGEVRSRGHMDPQGRLEMGSVPSCVAPQLLLCHHARGWQCTHSVEGVRDSCQAGQRSYWTSESCSHEAGEDAGLVQEGLCTGPCWGLWELSPGAGGYWKTLCYPWRRPGC